MFRVAKVKVSFNPDRLVAGILSQKEHLGKHEDTIINVNRKRGGTRRGVDVESRESSLQNKREATEDWCLFVVLFEKNHKHK